MAEHTNNIIELNGKRYDAITGACLGKSKTKAIPAASHAKLRHGRVLDGVQPSPKNLSPHKHLVTRVSTPPAPVRHKPAPSKTLMRHTVKKPQASLKTPIKTQSPAEIVATPTAKLVAKSSADFVDPSRLHRASQTPRHHDIRRFRPAQTRVQQLAPMARTPQRQHQSPAAIQIPKTGHRAKHDIFEDAIAHATSHRQPTPKIARRNHKQKRIRRIVAIVAIVIVAGASTAWINQSQIEIQIASLQAGIDARLPSYALTGYSLAQVDEKHGQVVINYRSGDSHYKITQQKSNWNSQTLLDAAVAGASTDKPQTLESKGRVIYLYSDNSAAWVDGGMRYEITGNAPLTSEDILAIVDSM